MQTRHWGDGNEHVITHTFRLRKGFHLFTYARVELKLLHRMANGHANRRLSPSPRMYEVHLARL